MLTKEYGVVVGHALVDASSGSGSVLIVNLNVEVVVLLGPRSLKIIILQGYVM